MPLRDMDREQMWLLPPTLDELLPSDHPARFMAEFVDALKREDWAEMDVAIDGDPLVSCIRSSSYYSEAFHQDRKTVFFLERSGTKAQVSTLFPTNYGYTTLVLQRRFPEPPSNGAWWWA